MEMEMEMRKRSDEGKAEGRKKRVKEEKGEQPVEEMEKATEEEVEEFYAILRRIHQVQRYFGKRKGGEGEGATKKKGGIWKPSFQWEDFEEVNVNNIKGREKSFAETVEENLVVPVALDLNAEPEPERI
ncbi:hypothetical protein NE237_005789 [Protea cynaroides]|uniref:Uncharacterized protein n=1 Tax=Protea cynaroides TaxID=273540 RepID=A0A9Q0QUU4_9MAGN|nr:hypothetical protein NE237_005789 [Protea cynaroides]